MSIKMLTMNRFEMVPRTPRPDEACQTKLKSEPKGKPNGDIKNKWSFGYILQKGRGGGVI